MSLMDAFMLNKQEKGLLATLFFAEFTRGAFFWVFLPIFAVNHLHLTTAIAGLATSIHFLSETVYKTMAGWQVDKARRSTVLSGLGLGLACLIIMRFHPLPMVLVVASAVFGLAMSPIWLTVISEVAPIEHSERTTRISTVFMVWIAGSGLGPVTITFILGKNDLFGFWFLIITWAVACLLAALSLADRPSRTRSVTSSSSFLRDLTSIISNIPASHILLPGMFLQTLAASSLITVLPVYMEKLGLSHSQYGLLLSIGGLTAILLFVPMSWVADRFPLKYLLFTGFGLSATSLLLLEKFKSFALLYLLAAMIGLACSIILPAWNSLLARLIPSSRQATGWGVFSTIEGAGTAVGPAVGGILARNLGYHAPFTFSALIFLSMTVFYLVYPAKKLHR